MLVEMHVEGIGVDQSSNTLVLLRDVERRRFLPIWIGPSEAVSIAMELESRQAPRPMTHDLITNMFRQLGVSLSRVVVSDFRDSTFFATITLQHNNTVTELDARPSDAIALALRAKIAIFAAERVLDAAAIRTQDNEEKTEIERFKRLIEGVDLQDLA